MFEGDVKFTQISSSREYITKDFGYNSICSVSRIILSFEHEIMTIRAEVWYKNGKLLNRIRIAAAFELILQSIKQISQFLHNKFFCDLFLEA